MFVALVMSGLAPLVSQDPGPGIAQELARARRAQIAKPEYDLEFTLVPGADHVRGRLTLRFELAAEPRDDVVLDFAGELTGDLRIQGVDARDHVRSVNGHLILPARLLAKGSNDVDVAFRSAIAATGTPLTRYRDAATGDEYLYTLLVPADAHRLFPCFDQPDLKGVFQLRLLAPVGWEVVANGPMLDRRTDSGATRWEFAPTTPLSTYLFAFAAGPFAVIESTQPLRHGADPTRPMRMFVRKEEQARVDAARIFEMHARSVDWLARQFEQPYPFAKLDFVLVPGFPYGGMEHAGAIFYRESALSFDHSPTAGELVARSALIYHEVSHQWFGNLVSFVWFDDLWLKEGFATFIAYRLLQELEPGSNAWVHFHRRVKPRAYEVDATPGTTPIYQALANLADAKSAYGAIVYNKAPAMLRELEARLGADRFRAGVARFLARHARANATWQDLVRALEEASGERLETWSNAWILGESLPRVRATWTVGVDGAIAGFAVVQNPVAGMARWPLRLEVLVASGSQRRRVAVELEGERVDVDELIGSGAPDWVILNPGDQAYGQFLLDPRSVTALLGAIPSEADPLIRAVALTALHETVRAGELDPARWFELVAALLTTEADPEAHAWLLDSALQLVLRYLAPPRAEPARRELERILLDQLRAPAPAVALQGYRGLLRIARGDETLDFIARTVRTRTLPGEVGLGAQDAFAGYGALLAAGSDAELRDDLPRQGDVANYAYMAEAARGDADTKERYFKTYLDPAEPPEQWVQQSLSSFHWPGQEAVTLPYLRRALDQVEWVKANRKIFFMPAWIDGFVNGHSSPEALAVVEAFLAERTDLEADIRRKILQSVDELRRVVRIRDRWK